MRPAALGATGANLAQAAVFGLAHTGDDFDGPMAPVVLAMVAAGLRTDLDARIEKIGYKIREAQLQKVPYMLVIGDREVAEGTVSVRGRLAGDLGARPLAEFVKLASEEVASKALASGIRPVSAASAPS